jgi:hypothetical protein
MILEDKPLISEVILSQMMVRCDNLSSVSSE